MRLRSHIKYLVCVVCTHGGISHHAWERLPFPIGQWELGGGGLANRCAQKYHGDALAQWEKSRMDRGWSGFPASIQ